jgi:uncharacterized protein (DUF1800 family)
METMTLRTRLLTGLLALVAAVSQAAPTSLTQEQARHLLLRSGFAPTQAEVDRWVGHSAQEAVNDIVARAKAAQPLHELPVSAIQPPPDRAALLSVEERQMARREQIREGFEIKRWWMREMIESPAPLAERMTLFWHNHFATSQQKVVRADAMWHQHRLLRAQALGNFRALLHDVARDPAMLIYLDGVRNRKEAPNENFAREVMELFTLGEATQCGGYTEHDIREAARAFTGWSLERETVSYRFRPALHDTGTKTVFGRSGNLDGDDVIDLLLRQPAAARFIATKLWKEFVSPQPDARELERIAEHFRSSGYDIAVAVHDLLLSDAFWTEANRGSLVKSPVELVVGTLRQFGVHVDDTAPLVQKCAQLGQNLLVPPNVKGWPGYTDWIDATTLIERKRFAEQVLRPAMMDGAGFDADRFLAPYGGHADREPDAGLQDRLVHALLAVPPAAPVAAGNVSSAWLRALAMDAAYQLK